MFSPSHSLWYYIPVRFKGRKVLIVGDSLSYPGRSPLEYTTPAEVPATAAPGVVLARHLLDLGARAVRINAKVGRSAYNLFRSENGDRLLAEDVAWGPDIVLVFLGTNDKGLGPLQDAAAFERIVKSFPREDIWALGPPQIAGYDDVVATMTEVFGRKFVDTRGMLTEVPKASDGVHFTRDGAKLLADRIAVALASTPSTWLPYAALGVLGATGVGFAWVIVSRMRAKRQLK